MDEDEEERVGFLSHSKRELSKTLDIGSEVLKNLQEDAEKLRRVKKTHDTINSNLNSAQTSVAWLQRRKYIELAFVCIVLFLVFGGVVLVLVKTVLK